MKPIHFPFLLILVCLTLVSVAGCSKSTSPTAPNTTTTTGPMPTAGSTFTVVDNSSGVVHVTVAGTPMMDTAHSGSKVIELLEQSIGTDTVFQSYLTSGDMAIAGSSWGAAGVFQVLPFSSHHTITTTFFDQVASVTDTIVAVYSGPGKMYTLNKQGYVTDSVTVTAYSQGTQIQYCYTFIPSLGLIASFNIPEDYTEWVTSYSQK